MRKLFFLTLISSLVSTACQNSQPQNKEAADLAQKAIDIHDDIMPRIAIFDRHTILIDSLLEHMDLISSSHANVDTAELRGQLGTLKTDLENATDEMMLWMREYNNDSTDVVYQEKEVQHMTKMKATFEKVATDAHSLLTPFNDIK